MIGTLRSTATLLVALVASAGVCAPAAAEDFTIRMRMVDGAQGTTYYVSSQAVRITTPGSTDHIARVDRGTVIFINHQKKTYTEGSAAELREAVKRKFDMSKLNPQKQALLQKMGMDAVPQLTKVGTGESVAGYPCEKYSIKTGTSQGELGITQALQFPSTYYRDFDFLSLPGANVGNFKDVRSVVLKRQTTSMLGRAVSATETAVSVQKAPIPSSMFEPPAGYMKRGKR